MRPLPQRLRWGQQGGRGSYLARAQRQGITLRPLVSGSAFVALPAVLLVVALPVRGDTWRLFAVAVGVLLFGVGLTGLRALSTGVGLPNFLTWVVSIAICAELIGTIFEVSGVALAVPVVAALAVALYVSDWRVGDCSLILLAMGLGSGIAYVLDNIVHDDNGSATDQAVPPLLAPSVALGLWALVRTRSIARGARLSVTVGSVLAVCTLTVALSTDDYWVAITAVPAVLLFGFGLAATGLGLIHQEPSVGGRTAQTRPALPE